MAHRNTISLDPRLSVIAELVGPCECLADIGCDHGRLGAFMLQSGRCRNALMSDISEDSLKKARKLIALLGLGDRVVFCVGDGADALPVTPDATVIAGMGGATIARILREGRSRLGGSRLVLQPNVGAPELRAALSAGGWRIVDERIARDGRRLYVAIAAEEGGSDYTLRERIVGPVLLERMPPELEPYASFRLRVAQKARGGALAGGDPAQVCTLEREVEIWEEVLRCLQR